MKAQIEHCAMINTNERLTNKRHDKRMQKAVKCAVNTRFYGVSIRNVFE